MTAAARGRGVTLVELIVAGAVLVLLVGLVGGALIRAHRLGGTDADGLERTLRHHAVIDAVRFELARAGWEVDGSILEVARNPRTGETSGQVLRFRFVEDRWRADPVLRIVELTAGRDGAGRWSLYRRDGTSPRQPVVAGLTRLVVARAATPSGWVDIPDAPGTIARAYALELDLAFDDGRVRTVIAPLRTPLPVSVAAALA